MVKCWGSLIGNKIDRRLIHDLKKALNFTKLVFMAAEEIDLITQRESCFGNVGNIGHFAYPLGEGLVGFWPKQLPGRGVDPPHGDKQFIATFQQCLDRLGGVFRVLVR